MIQGLEQVGHLGEGLEYGLLISGGARVHGVHRGALLGAQRATVEERRRQIPRSGSRHCLPGRIADPAERPVGPRCAQLDLRIEIGLRDAHGAGRRMQLRFRGKNVRSAMGELRGQAHRQLRAAA